MFILEPTLLFTILILWLLVAMILAPLEALGWWAGWFEGDEENADLQTNPIPPYAQSTPPHARRYLVYLTGISGVSGEVFLDEENALLHRLDTALPHVVVVDDVYPYGVANQALTGQRVFAWFWRFALNRKLSGKPLQRYVGLLINIRNAFQVAVSADRRYGPIYNYGSAQMIVRGLFRHGYPVGSGMPITLLGYSGGGQIALGAVPYLRKMLNAPVRVISLGGVLSADPGVSDVEHVYHLYGKHDRVHRFGYIVSPSRWRIGKLAFLPRSRWNRALNDGHITTIHMGNMTHNGKGGYLDDTRTLPNTNTSHIDYTVQRITQIVG